jgi:hypothetical protein
MRHGQASLLTAALTLALPPALEAQTLEEQRSGAASGQFFGLEVDIDGDTVVLGERLGVERHQLGRRGHVDRERRVRRRWLRGRSSTA